MHINDDGLNIIKESEGLRLKAYKCPSGVWTIGYGHTGKDVKKGMVITEEKATELLKRDIARFERHVSAYNKIYNFTSNEFSALVSFAFNLGSITGLTKNGIRTKQQIANKMFLPLKSKNAKVKPPRAEISMLKGTKIATTISVFFKAVP